MHNPFYFTDRVLKTEHNKNLKSHHFDHINSKITIKPNQLEIEELHAHQIVKQMSTIYAGLMSQYKHKNQIVFSERFDKQGEDDKVLDEVMSYINLNTNQN